MALLAASCGGHQEATAAVVETPAPDASAPSDPGPYFPLGMNDVTILAPLPASAASPTILRASDLKSGKSTVENNEDEPVLGYDAFLGLVKWVPDNMLPIGTYDRLQIVALRFDLCDRSKPGPCTRSDDGRLRMVLQAIADDATAEDVALHVFYSVPNDEVPGLIGELRALARIQSEPPSSPLKASPALASGNAAYANALRDLVRRHASHRRFVRLTTILRQPPPFAPNAWYMTGIVDPAGIAPVRVGDSIVSAEAPVLVAHASYDVESPSEAYGNAINDKPPGLDGILKGDGFESHTDARKKEELALLATVDNPLVSSPDTAQCIACHASTVVAANRATRAGIDLGAITGRYTSTHDLSIDAGHSRETDLSLRALGWLGSTPMISQRVVNETAQVVDEVEAQFH
jgi:hypothetical protein